jgi:uridine kinase
MNDPMDDPMNDRMDDATRDATHPADAPAPVPVGEPLRRLLARDFDVPGAGPRVVAIAGESGSGKTVAASELVAALEAAGAPTGLLHQDDYFVRPPRTNHEHRERDIDSVGPQEVDLARLAAHVAAFRRGEDGVAGPRVDYPGNRFVEVRHDFAGRRVLVVEGTYVLGLPDVDVRVFCAATYLDTRERRRRRARDVDSPFVERVLAIEHVLIAPYAARADVVIGLDYVLRRTTRA